MGISIQTLFFFLLVAQVCLAQWVQVGLDDYSINDIAVQNSNIFAVTSDSGKVYRSIDSGTNWTMIVDSNAADIAISPTGKVFMVWDSLRIYNPYPFSKGGLLSSSDNGNTWIWSDIMEQLVDSIPLGGWQNHITVSPTGTVFCNITPLGGLPIYDVIARSTDDGMVWTTPGMSVLAGRLLDFREQFVITIGESAGFGGHGVATNYSSDDGNTWAFLGYPQTIFFHALSLFSNGNIIVGGIYPGGGPKAIHVSNDMCSTWTQIAILNSQVGLSWSSGSSEGMLIGTEDLGVFLFTDEGDSLGLRNEGLTSLNVQALTLDNNGYVYAGTGNGVWRRPLTEIVTSVEDEITQPTSFILEQNFPNPFNPRTTISYQLPTYCDVTIKVYDVLGDEIAILVNEEKPAGTYEITWNAASLPSGVYFYQLKADNYIETKKMILLR